MENNKVLSKRREITKKSFRKDVNELAKDLLGCVLQYNGLEAVIENVKPFEGTSRYSHGKENFKQEPGYVWVNKGRGGNHLLNINAYEENSSCIVVTGIKLDDISIKGPGRVTKALNIDDTLTGSYIGEDIKIYK